MSFADQTALVTKTAAKFDDCPRYLLLDGEGAPRWVDDPEAATSFASMREALRMALRIPSSERAYGMPREPEVSMHRSTH